MLLPAPTPTPPAELPVTTGGPTTGTPTVATTGGRTSGGLRPPARRVAAARAKYTKDGSTGLTGAKLVVALYERLQRDLTGAHQAIDARQIEAAHLHLVHAQEILEHLDDALDPTVWDYAPRLSGIYRHLCRELVAANIRKDAGAVARCRTLVDSLAETWQTASEQAAADQAPTAPAATAG